MWDTCKVFALKQNIRPKDSEGSFAPWLLSVGHWNTPINGTKFAYKDDFRIVVVDPKFLMQLSRNHLQNIFQAIKADNILSKITYANITKTAILTLY